jgi:GST-like protein
VLQNLYGAAEFLDVAGYRHVVRWATEIAERPAVKRGIRVNRTKEADALRERHAATDFD